MQPQPYAAEQSANMANGTTLTGFVGVIYGYATSAEGVMLIGAVATVLGAIYGAVAAYQKRKEHLLRMEIMQIEKQIAQKKLEDE